MKKIVVSIIAIFVILSIVIIPVYATNVSQENSTETTVTTNLVELKDKACSKLVNLLSGEEIAVCDGKAVVDVDRKQAAIYRME